MSYIHTLKCLPSDKAIQSVSLYSERFEQEALDYKALLISLRKTVFKHNLMTELDNWEWASNYGRDYFYNPRLFAKAPLSHVCAFISEVFKRYDIDRINRGLPIDVLKLALKRLKSFAS